MRVTARAASGAGESAQPREELGQPLLIDLQAVVELRRRRPPHLDPRIRESPLQEPDQELAVFSRERHEGDDLVLDVVTGMLDGNATFAPHGHTLRITVAGAHG